MQRQAWGKLLWLTVVSLCISFTASIFAQNPPALTHQPSYWQPIARVNSHSQILVTLVNQTKIPLKYNFLDDRGEKDLPVEANTQLKIFSLPVNIAIYDPLPQAASGKASELKYEPAVTKNKVTVNIVPVEKAGLNVINIAKTGAIYVY